MKAERIGNRRAEGRRSTASGLEQRHLRARTNVSRASTRQAAAMLHNELVESGELEESVIPGIWVFGHTGLSRAEEAHLFTELNGPNRLRVHVVHRYEASLIWGEPTARAAWARAGTARARSGQCRSPSRPISQNHRPSASR